LLVKNLVDKYVRTSKLEISDGSVLFCRGRSVAVEFSNCGRAVQMQGRILDSDDQTVTISLANTCKAEFTEIESNYVRVGFAAQGGYYTFASRILDCRFTGALVQLILCKPMLICRVQRRQHERFSIHVPVCYTVSIQGIAPETATVVKYGETENIGFSGVCIAAEECLNPGSIVNLTLNLLDGSGTPSAIARVLRSVPSRHRSPWSWLLGCQFLDSGLLLDDLIQRMNLASSLS
ncbi:MAG: PilZ domain-containing protein, partial [Armatimonadota bacterium]|nr:PilZ domain-containing protein [Armatimonadota bacterium]